MTSQEKDQLLTGADRVLSRSVPQSVLILCLYMEKKLIIVFCAGIDGNEWADEWMNEWENESLFESIDSSTVDYEHKWCPKNGISYESHVASVKHRVHNGWHHHWADQKNVGLDLLVAIFGRCLECSFIYE